jgi:hypothetical protein
MAQILKNRVISGDQMRIKSHHLALPRRGKKFYCGWKVDWACGFLTLRRAWIRTAIKVAIANRKLYSWSSSPHTYFFLPYWLMLRFL